METHTVRRNETLSEIADDYGVTLEELLNANPQLRRHPDRIFVGQIINLPPGTCPTGRPAVRRHIVQQGETFFGIAVRYRVTPDAILDANRPAFTTYPNNLRVGQIINLPPGVCVPTYRVRMKFNGTVLKIINLGTGAKTMYPAVSGLPSVQPGPRAEGLRDAGPIPTNTYRLSLTEDMAWHPNTQNAGPGWGDGGWPLTPSEPAPRLAGESEAATTARRSRYGFYLHDDGVVRGTHGCIGIIRSDAARSDEISAIQRILRDAYRDGQREVEVVVRYPWDRPQSSSASPPTMTRR